MLILEEAAQRAGVSAVERAGFSAARRGAG
jgi:hypothetical protein